MNICRLSVIPPICLNSSTSLPGTAADLSLNVSHSIDESVLGHRDTGLPNSSEPPLDDADPSFHVSNNFVVPVPEQEDTVMDGPNDETLPDDRPNLAITCIPSGSKRGKAKLADNLGYSYTVKRRHTFVIYWECSVRRKNFRCPATVIERNGTFIRGNNRHIHPPKSGAATNLKIQATVHAKAQENIFHPAGALVQHALLDMVDDRRPNPDVPSIQNLVS